MFQLEHDVFEADRPENRLLKSALLEVCQLTRDAELWRWSHQLAAMLHEIPHSHDLRGDLGCWSEERLMTAYRAVRPWCMLILRRLVPLAMIGRWEGPSLLFPMERLFERYVHVCLQRQIGSAADVRRTPSTRHLCSQDGRSMFQLKPDLAIHQAGKMVSLLDAKWKQIQGDAAEGNYGLGQADFYQMFAYGHRYLEGRGEMALIYPRTPDFRSPLRPFAFNEAMSLHVLPFDLVEDRLIGLERVFSGGGAASLVA